MIVLGAQVDILPARSHDSDTGGKRGCQASYATPWYCGIILTRRGGLMSRLEQHRGEQRVEGLQVVRQLAQHRAQLGLCRGTEARGNQ